MQTQQTDHDRHAPERVFGVMAQLALPELRTASGSFRKPLIEIEISPNRWEPVDALSITDEKIVFSFGVNGHRVEYVYLKGEGCPRWRRVRAQAMHGFGVGCA